MLIKYSNRWPILSNFQYKRSPNFFILPTKRMIINSLKINIRKSFILKIKNSTLTKISIRKFEILIYVTFTYNYLTICKEKYPIVVICYWRCEIRLNILELFENNYILILLSIVRKLYLLKVSSCQTWPFCTIYTYKSKSSEVIYNQIAFAGCIDCELQKDLSGISDNSLIVFLNPYTLSLKISLIFLIQWKIILRRFIKLIEV